MKAAVFIFKILNMKLKGRYNYAARNKISKR